MSGEPRLGRGECQKPPLGFILSLHSYPTRQRSSPPIDEHFDWCITLTRSLPALQCPNLILLLRLSRIHSPSSSASVSRAHSLRALAEWLQNVGALTRGSLWLSLFPLAANSHSGMWTFLPITQHPSITLHTHNHTLDKLPWAALPRRSESGEIGKKMKRRRRSEWREKACTYQTQINIDLSSTGATDGWATNDTELKLEIGCCRMLME